MPIIHANNIDIAYDAFGDPSHPALILIMGLGAQMIWWDEDFCGLLGDEGFYVIRLDNRDIGLSTRFDHEKISIVKCIDDMMNGLLPKPPYTMADMANDVFGLMDALGIEKAHICGASMGGMIAQRMAIMNQDRLYSLISIMSSTGNPLLPQPTPQAHSALFSPPPTEREEYIEYALEAWRTIGSPVFPFDEKHTRRKIAESYDRSNYFEGIGRQMLAIMMDGNRSPLLEQVRIPALVIHGEDDPLVPVDHGKDTALAIPNSVLLILKGMGHDIPRRLWPRIVDAISALKPCTQQN